MLDPCPTGRTPLFVATLSILTLAMPAAHATGTLACTGGNGPFRVDATLAMGRSSVNPIANAGGRVELGTKRLPSDLATVLLDRDALVHHWFEGDQVNLHFYKERDDGAPFGYVEAVITTRKVPKSAGAYSGRFKLKVSYLKKTGDATPVEFMTTGGVKCEEE